jgi:hypothetical protein
MTLFRQSLIHLHTRRHRHGHTRRGRVLGPATKGAQDVVHVRALETVEAENRRVELGQELMAFAHVPFAHRGVEIGCLGEWFHVFRRARQGQNPLGNPLIQNLSRVPGAAYGKTPGWGGPEFRSTSTQPRWPQSPLSAY